MAVCQEYPEEMPLFHSSSSSFNNNHPPQDFVDAVRRWLISCNISCELIIQKEQPLTSFLADQVIQRQVHLLVLSQASIASVGSPVMSRDSDRADQRGHPRISFGFGPTVSDCLARMTLVCSVVVIESGSDGNEPALHLFNASKSSSSTSNSVELKMFFGLGTVKSEGTVKTEGTAKTVSNGTNDIAKALSNSTDDMAKQPITSDIG